MTEGSFAQYVPRDVIKQIKVREEKFKKPDKTVEEFEVIHGNTVWCLLRSGVNAPKKLSDRLALPGSADDQRSIMDAATNEEARKGVLGGEQLPVGESGRFEGMLAGVQSVPDNKLSAYNKGEYQGHRPIPGITGFSVKTKDTWGMILEADIKIRVWSREDLERMDLIYFKPGFPALFEWGHSLYFRPDGSVEKNPKLMVSNEVFFKGGKFEDLDNTVYQARQKDCNREALFGYITNFSWSFNADGSFDCSLKLLSKGGVLEGLRMSKTTEESSGNKQKQADWWDTSNYHAVLKKLMDRYTWLNNHSPETVSIAATIPTLEDKTKRDDPTKIPGRKLINESKGDYQVISLSKALGTEGDPKLNLPNVVNLVDIPVAAVIAANGHNLFRRDVHFFYMSLRSILHLINVFDGGESECYWDTTSQAKFGHSKDKSSKEGKVMPSLNPYVAIKPSQSGDYRPSDSGVFSTIQGSYDQCKGTDEILNIWVSYNVFVDIVKSHIVNKAKDYSVKDIVADLLAQIQKAFGNVNNFSFWNRQDAGGSCYEIVDLSYVVAENEGEIPVINISGLDNTVVEFSAHSDVSNDIVNEMCIAATAPTPKTEGSENADECLVFWGENCKARWETKRGALQDNKSVIKNEESKSDDDYEKDWTEKIKKLYDGFRGGSTAQGKKSDLEAEPDKILAIVSEKFSNVQTYGEKFYKDQVKIDARSKAEFTPGIIPFKANITLLGISRMYIGNTFKVRNTVLPQKYDNWGYIITGIDHKIQNNQWFTTLTTQYYPIFGNSVPKSKLTGGDGLKSNSSTTSTSTTSKGIDNSEVKPIQPDSESIENDCSYRKALTEDSGITYGGGYHGLCARYTANWARAFVIGKSAIKGAEYDSAKGIYKPSVGAGGNAYDGGYFNSLTGIGYSKGEEISATGAEISKLTAGSKVNGVEIKEGDVIAFESEDGSKYHTCFFDGTRWCSDTDQKTANCYSSNGPYKLRLFSAPAKSPDWDCGVNV